MAALQDSVRTSTCSHGHYSSTQRCPFVTQDHNSCVGCANDTDSVGLAVSGHERYPLNTHHTPFAHHADRRIPGWPSDRSSSGLLDD